RRANFKRMFRLLTKARPAVDLESAIIRGQERPHWDYLPSTVGLWPVRGNGTEVPCVSAVKPPRGRVRDLLNRTGLLRRRTGGRGWSCALSHAAALVLQLLVSATRPRRLLRLVT